MRTHYSVDELLNNRKEVNLDLVIDKKISLLYDFCILTRRRHKPDPRENDVRMLLCRYNSEMRMTNVLHDVLVGDKTINQLLEENENAKNHIYNRRIS